MTRSMTGYGRAQQVIDGRNITVEIRSVNHRFFEFNSRIPRIYGFLDEKLKSYVQSKVARGKIEVSVLIITTETENTKVEINYDLAASYITALRELGERYGLEDDLSLSAIGRYSDIFNVCKEPEDEEVIWNAVKTVLDQALDSFMKMKETEGKKLYEDIVSRLDRISELVTVVEQRSPLTTQEYREKLYRKLSEVLKEKQIDEYRILTEAAIFAEKVAVDEETVRLRSHIAQGRHILDGAVSSGRKLDFLIQEFNREANTIGSKAQDVSIAKTVVEIKSEIEKIREQVQNIE